MIMNNSFRKRTIWSLDLDMFEGEDQMRWCFKGGKGAPPPPPPPPEEPRDDGRPDDAKSKGIEEAARTRFQQKKKGSRGGLKIGLNPSAGTGINVGGQ